MNEALEVLKSQWSSDSTSTIYLKLGNVYSSINIGVDGFVIYWLFYLHKRI